MKFLVDANLPRLLVAWLAGSEARYVDDLLTPPASDDDIWHLARAQGFVIVKKKDADFAARAARDASVRVVWIRCGNLKLVVFESWFAARMEAMLRLLQMDEPVVELR